MLRVIREVSPKWIVGENVFGIVNWSGGLVFEEVQADLEREGYEVQSYILPAAGVDAPHKRDRVWFVAYSNRGRYSSGREQISEENGIQGERREEVGSRFVNRAGVPRLDASNAGHTRLQGSEEFRNLGERGKKPYQQFAGCFFSTWQNFPTQSPICFGNDGISSDTYTETVSKEHTMDRDIVIKKALEQGRLVADHQTGKIYSTTLRGRNGEKVELPGSDCNGYRVHNIYVDGIKKQCRAHQIVWISANGLYDKKKLMIDHINRDRSDNRLSNLRLVDSKGNAENAERWKGNFSQNEKDLMHELHTNGHMSFMELAEHFECSKSRVHQIVSEHNGIYGIAVSKWRNESIKAAGNAVVPQVVLQIFKAIQAYEDSI